MNANSVTYIGFVQDHSGSMKMNGKDELAMTNFNEQRAKLLKDDDETMDNVVTIIEFDDDVQCVVDNVPIVDVKEYKHWWTGGKTSLYDAIASCIKNIQKKIDEDEREDKAALIIIQTDGHENDSTDYVGEEGRQRINKMITELEDTERWSFVFLGENIDKKVVMEMGMSINNIKSHGSDKDELRYAYASNSDALGKFLHARKCGATQTKNFYDDGNDSMGNDNSFLSIPVMKRKMPEIKSGDILNDNKTKGG